MRIRTLITPPLLVAALGATQPPPKPVAVVGMYTDMRYIEEAGDVLGTEVFLVRANGGWYAVVQCAGGEPAKPVVVPARVTELRVAFTLPPRLPECGAEFTGQVTRAGLRGRFRGESTDRWLPRRASYW